MKKSELRQLIREQIKQVLIKEDSANLYKFIYKEFKKNGKQIITKMKDVLDSGAKPSNGPYPGFNMNDIWWAYNKKDKTLSGTAMRGKNDANVGLLTWKNVNWKTGKATLVMTSLVRDYLK